jgi:hypothetical protein
MTGIRVIIGLPTFKVKLFFLPIKTYYDTARIQGRFGRIGLETIRFCNEYRGFPCKYLQLDKWTCSAARMGTTTPSTIAHAPQSHGHFTGTAHEGSKTGTS